MLHLDGTNSRPLYQRVGASTHVPVCPYLNIAVTRPEIFTHLQGRSRVFVLVDLVTRALTDPAEILSSMLPAAYIYLNKQKPLNLLSWKLTTTKANKFCVGFSGAVSQNPAVVLQSDFSTTGVYNWSASNSAASAKLHPFYSRNSQVFRTLCEDSTLFSGICAESSDLVEFAVTCNPQQTALDASDDITSANLGADYPLASSSTNDELGEHSNVVSDISSEGVSLDPQNTVDNSIDSVSGDENTNTPSNPSPADLVGGDVSQDTIQTSVEAPAEDPTHVEPQPIDQPSLKGFETDNAASIKQETDEADLLASSQATILSIDPLVSSFFFGFCKENVIDFDIQNTGSADEFTEVEEVSYSSSDLLAGGFDPYEGVHKKQKYIKRIRHYRKLKPISAAGVLRSLFTSSIPYLIPAYDALFFSQFDYGELPYPKNRMSAAEPRTRITGTSMRLAYAHALNTWGYHLPSSKSTHPLTNQHIEALSLAYFQARPFDGFYDYSFLWNACRVYSAATMPLLPAYEGFRFLWSADYIKPYLIPFNWKDHSKHEFFTFWFKDLQSPYGVLSNPHSAPSDTPNTKLTTNHFSVLDSRAMFLPSLFNFRRWDSLDTPNDLALEATAAASAFRNLDRGAPIRWRAALNLLPRSFKVKFIDTYKHNPYGWLPAKFDSYPLTLLHHTQGYTTPIAFVMLFFFRLADKRTIFNNSTFLWAFKSIFRRNQLISYARVSFDLTRKSISGGDTRVATTTHKILPWKLCVPSSKKNTSNCHAIQNNLIVEESNSMSFDLQKLWPATIGPFFNYVTAICFFSIIASPGAFLQKIDGFSYCLLPKLTESISGYKVTVGSLTNTLRNHLGVCLPSWFFLFCLFADMYSHRPSHQPKSSKAKAVSLNAKQRKGRLDRARKHSPDTFCYYYYCNLGFSVSAYLEYLYSLYACGPRETTFLNFATKSCLSDKLSKKTHISNKKIASTLATTKYLLNTPEVSFRLFKTLPNYMHYLNVGLCDMYSFAINSFKITQFAKYKRQLLRLENLTKKVSARKRRKQKKRGYVPRQQVYSTPSAPSLTASWEYVDRYLDICTSSPHIRRFGYGHKADRKNASAKPVRNKTFTKKKFSTSRRFTAHTAPAQPFCIKKTVELDYPSTFNLVKKIASVTYGRNSFLATCDSGSNLKNLKTNTVSQPGDSRVLGIIAANTSTLVSAQNEVRATQAHRKVNFFTYSLLRQRVFSDPSVHRRKVAPVWLFRRKLNIFWFRTNRQLKKTRQNLQNALSRILKLHLYLKNKNTCDFFYKKYIFRFFRFLYYTQRKKTQLVYSTREQRLVKLQADAPHAYKDPRKSLINLKRPLIKIFWNSQKLWREAFFRKKRWTARKFINYFTRWYKKNKPTTLTLNKGWRSPQLWTFLVRINLFLSKKDCIVGLASRVFLINFKTPADVDYVLKKNDTVSLPPQYGYLVKLTLSKRLLLRRIVKKGQYIYFKNKESRWKNIKKKFDKRLQNILFTKNSIPNYVQFDFFTSMVCFIKSPKDYLRPETYTHRHALEKLNTWRLKI